MPFLQSSGSECPNIYGQSEAGFRRRQKRWLASLSTSLRKQSTQIPLSRIFEAPLLTRAGARVNSGASKILERGIWVDCFRSDVESEANHRFCRRRNPASDCP